MRYLVYSFLVAAFFDSAAFDLGGRTANISWMLGLVLLVAFAVFRARLARQWRRTGWYLAFLFTISCEELIRVLTLDSSAVDISVRHFFSYAQVLLMFLIVAELGRDPRLLLGIVRVYLVIVLVMCVLSLARFPGLTGSAPGGRIGVVGINLNQQALLYAATLAGIATWLMRQWPRFGWRTTLTILSGLLILVALASTGSRGGGAALVFGLAAVLFVHFAVRRLPVYVFMVPLVLVGVAYVLATSDVLTSRLDATLAGDSGYRIELAEVGIRMFKQKPLLGWGAGYVEVMGKLMGWERVGAHNTYLQTLISFGVIGAVPLFVAIAVTFLRSWRYRSSGWGAVWVSVLGVMVSFAFTGHLAYQKHFWIILAIGVNIDVLTMMPMPGHVRVQPEPIRSPLAGDVSR